jgi:hypothetical protein
MNRYQAHRDEPQRMTLRETAEAVLTAIIVIVALWAFYLLAWSVWGS